MIDLFTGGDPDIAHGLNKVYADRRSLPNLYGKIDERADKFAQEMMAAFRENRGKK